MCVIATLIIFPLIFYPKIQCADFIEHPVSLEDETRELGHLGLDYYNVVTADGYILTLMRLRRKNPEKLRPILLVHGVTACGDTFFLVQNDSAPFFLSENGYDVWIFNSRGTKRSLGHTTLNPNTDKEYWYYSWQEIGRYDLPASVDFVLGKNDHDKLVLIGHSAGTTIIMVMLSELPEYNDKVLLSALWGASIYHENCSTFVYVAALCDLEPLLSRLSESVQIYRIFPFLNVQEIMQEMCSLRTFREVCIKIINFLTYRHEITKDVPNWSTLLDRGFCGGSLRELFHFMQVGSSGRFAKYNFGPKKNLQTYNSTEPPLFRLSNVRSPVIVWCGIGDQFCTRNDFKKLVAELPNVVSTTFVGESVFEHTDFILAKDLKRYLYQDFLELLEKYENLDKSKLSKEN